MAINITIDTNGIIDLEENRPDAKYYQEMIRFNNTGQIQINIPAISASERKPCGNFAQNFQEFVQKVEKAGINEYQILNCLAYTEVTYLGHCVIAGDESLKLEMEIHEILFPNFPYRSTVDVDRKK